jgi:hypothetical protein
MKQMAQAVTLAVAGVQELCNEVEVIPTAALPQRALRIVGSFSTQREKVHEW